MLVSQRSLAYASGYDARGVLGNVAATTFRRDAYIFAVAFRE